MPSIVQVNVSQQIAPTPPTLQQTGALISQGGTTLASGTSALLTQLSSLTSILATPLALTSAVLTTGTVTATTAVAHGITSGDVFLTTIAGVTPTGYNGTFVATATGASTFTYALTGSLGSGSGGTYTPRNQAELLEMATTFFAQGSGVAVYVLELGAGEPAAGVTALTTYITANPNSAYSPGAQGFFYTYLVPRAWDGVSSFLAMLADFESTSAQTYFFITSTSANYTDYTDLMKCAIVMIEAPGVANIEYDQAAAMWRALSYNPSTTNRVAPFAFSFVEGVTPYPTVSNNSFLTELKSAAVNYIGTGAEGGIANTILLWGTTMDGNDFTYWYGVDWVQINVNINISNAVINGSQNSINPLWYQQDGVNRLQTVAVSTVNTGITYGLILGTTVATQLDGVTFDAAIDAGTYGGQAAVNAVPFYTYSQENPDDYKVGKYAGFSVVYIPSRGFIQIVFNVLVTEFVTQ